MAKITEIGERLFEQLKYLENNPIAVNKIVSHINGYKYKDSGELLTLEDKNKIISAIEKKINEYTSENEKLLLESESAKNLKVLLKKIKEKINGK